MRQKYRDKPDVTTRDGEEKEIAPTPPPTKNKKQEYN